MAKLRSYPAKSWPRVCGWLVPGFNCTELGYRISQRVHSDIGVFERPLGSNWGGRVTTVIQRFGFERPEYWCGFEVAAVWSDCGAMVPENPWDCDTWLEHMQSIKDVNVIDLPGAAILFGKPGDAKHIEIITRAEKKPDTLVCTVGGNKGVKGTPSENANNGVGVSMDILSRKDVLGVVVPTLRPDLTEPLPVDFR